MVSQNQNSTSELEAVNVHDSLLCNFSISYLELFQGELAIDVLVSNIY